VSFLNPIWLLLAGAVAVPLILHLMRRRIETRLEFPAARYLARAERENIRRLKLRNLLLMLLRALAVFFLALAAARPIGWLMGGGHVPTALALVVDNSLSSGVIIDGAPLLNQLKQAARTVVDASTAADRLWVVTVDAQVTGGAKGVVGDAIDRLDVFGGRGDLAAAVTRAAGVVLAAGLPAREVVVISDGQASQWPASLTLGDVRTIVYTPSTTPPENRAVAVAEPRPSRWTPRGALVVRASGADSATYRVSLGDRTLARGLLRGDEEVIVRTEPALRGWAAGRVELAPDELRGDDERHFAVWIGPAPAVRVHASAGEFAVSAMEALVQSERATTGGAIEIAPADAVSSLPALILAPSDPVRLGAANRSLERLGLPWRFGEARRDNTIARRSTLDGTEIRLRYPLRSVAAGASDTLALASGEPWIVAGEQYVLLASPLDPAATDLPVRAQFLPWLSELIGQRLTSGATTTIQSLPGAALRLPQGVTGMERDDGQVLPVTGSETAPTRAGVYFLRRGADRMGAVVVNVEAEESRLARLDTRELDSRIRSSERLVTADQSRLSRSVFEIGARRPLQGLLLVLAMGCLMFEMFIVRRAERQGRRRAA
jgi:hypothetical protein